MLPAWASQYVGLPFRDQGRERTGVDCWGLCQLVWREQFGLEVPSYVEHYRTACDDQEIGALVRGELAIWWHPVPLEQARAGDGIVFRVLGQPMHIGTIVDPPWFLHVEKGVNAALDRYTGLRWARRIIGVFRHVSLVVPQEVPA